MVAFRTSDSMPYLVTRKLDPENQESPVHFLTEALTPEPYFFRRNHFPYPGLSRQSFVLTVQGDVLRPLTFHYQDLLRMPSKEITMVLECSGNKRGHFQPGVYGEQWEDGAISQGVWKGVPLHYLLEWTGLLASAMEVVFEGSDSGKRTDLEGEFVYARSLPLEKALHPDTLIAYELNGKPIPYKHGYPFRLIVPQWYAMASVKWLRTITVTRTPFTGPFQTVDYMYYPEKDSDAGKTPVTAIHVNSTIQQPFDWNILDTGMHRIYGIAWIGTGAVVKVEVSVDGGSQWTEASLHPLKGHPYGWTFWSLDWHAPQKGEYLLMSRATDSFGSMQPMEAQWNRKGYGYNAVHVVHVKVE